MNSVSYSGKVLKVRNSTYVCSPSYSTGKGKVVYMSTEVQDETGKHSYTSHSLPVLGRLSRK